MRHDEYLDALRISETEQKSILKELDQTDLAHPSATKRRAKRYPYVVREGLIFEVEGAATRFVVRPRDVSESGLSFLHGSFLHPGRSCIVALKTVDGEHVIAHGRIVRCRCVRGRVHDVGMKFDQPVDLASFIGPPKAAQPAPESANACAASPYSAEELLLLIGQFQTLVGSQAPRDQLFQTLARMVAILREGWA